MPEEMGIYRGEVLSIMETLMEIRAEIRDLRGLLEDDDEEETDEDDA
jgi:hypothetical protein